LPDSHPIPPTKRDLFLGFLKIGMLGFGGVAPYARHVIVEERGWLTDQDYLEVLGVGQALPGPNTMNAAILIGYRFHGAAGAAVGVVGQLLVPLVAVVALSALYDRFAAHPEVVAALAGAAAVASGLVLGTGVKMALKIRLRPSGAAIAAAAFVAIGLLHWPLIPVVLTLAPLGVALAKPAR
jgi:chromate transporter